MLARSSFVVRPNVANARLAAPMARRVLFVAQRDASDHLAVGRTDDVHDFLAMGLNERTIDVVGGDCLHSASLDEDSYGQNEVTTTRFSEPSLSAA